MQVPLNSLLPAANPEAKKEACQKRQLWAEILSAVTFGTREGHAKALGCYLVLPFQRDPPIKLVPEQGWFHIITCFGHFCRKYSQSSSQNNQFERNSPFPIKQTTSLCACEGITVQLPAHQLNERCPPEGRGELSKTVCLL